MLYAYGFDRIGVVAGDLYFVNPDPAPGEEGPERGVRLEIRLFERGDLKGGIYSARPIAVDRPMWRVDLLESVANPGTLDRAHHHPRFTGWEPGPRVFVHELTADPVGWVAERLSRFDEVLEAAGVGCDEVGADDIADVRRSAGEIMAAVQRLLDRVQDGDLARVPDGDTSGPARVGWL